MAKGKPKSLPTEKLQKAAERNTYRRRMHVERVPGGPEAIDAWLEMRLENKSNWGFHRIADWINDELGSDLTESNIREYVYRRRRKLWDEIQGKQMLVQP